MEKQEIVGLSMEILGYIAFCVILIIMSFGESLLWGFLTIAVLLMVTGGLISIFSN